jgi:8-oxo-dGTP pyrophosphatase MutT (NUDIX family)
MPYQGMYLMEELHNQKNPENIGKRRFPGGGIEDGESPTETAVRELYEELGLICSESLLHHLGTLPHLRWGHDEHFFYLGQHNLKPGIYRPKFPEGGGDPFVLLVAAIPQAETYLGNLAVRDFLYRPQAGA